MGKVIQNLTAITSNEVSSDDKLPISDVSLPRTKSISIEELQEINNPVGTIYINASVSTNPAILLKMPNSTWVAWGVGKAVVGIDPTQTEFDTLNETGGSKTHRHKGYGDGDGLGNGDLRATIGSASGDAASLNFQALDALNPNTGAGLGNGTYSVNGTGGSNRGFSHYTKVVGYTSTNSTLMPYQVGYVWRRTA